MKVIVILCVFGMNLLSASGAWNECIVVRLCRCQPRREPINFLPVTIPYNFQGSHGELIVAIDAA